MPSSVRPAAQTRLALELDGHAPFALHGAEGGDAYGDVVRTVEPDGSRSNRIGTVRYSDIAVEVGGDVDPGLLDWMSATFERQFAPRAGAVLFATLDGKVEQRLEFQNSFLREVRFPALDAASRDVARLVLKLAPESTQRRTGVGGSLGGATGQKAKSSLASNFRLAIDGLDCSRVSRVGEMVVRAVVADDVTGELRHHAAPVGLECSDLVVTLSEADADGFFEWHERFVVKGESDKGSEKGGRLEYLDPTLKTALLPLDLGGLGIYRLVTNRAGDGIRTVTAAMYCHSLKFARPPVTPAPAPAAIPGLGGQGGEGIPTRPGGLPGLPPRPG
jgi:hypothetical protein